MQILHMYMTPVKEKKLVADAAPVWIWAIMTLCVRGFQSFTFSEEQEKLSFLQLQGETVLGLSLCVKQYPRVLQGFKFQGDAFPGHLPRPGTQPVH